MKFNLRAVGLNLTRVRTLGRTRVTFLSWMTRRRGRRRRIGTSTVTVHQRSRKSKWWRRRNKWSQWRRGTTFLLWIRTCRRRTTRTRSTTSRRRRCRGSRRRKHNQNKNKKMINLTIFKSSKTIRGKGGGRIGRGRLITIVRRGGAGAPKKNPKSSQRSSQNKLKSPK